MQNYYTLTQLSKPISSTSPSPKIIMIINNEKIPPIHYPFTDINNFLLSSTSPQKPSGPHRVSLSEPGTRAHTPKNKRPSPASQQQRKTEQKNAPSKKRKIPLLSAALSFAPFSPERTLRSRSVGQRAVTFPAARARR